MPQPSFYVVRITYTVNKQGNLSAYLHDVPVLAYSEKEAEEKAIDYFWGCTVHSSVHWKREVRKTEVRRGTPADRGGPVSRIASVGGRRVGEKDVH